MSKFNELRKLNLNELLEKKGNLSYLSWAHAADILLQNDPEATWEFPPAMFYEDGSVMVFCNVTAMGKTMRMQLPVMDNRNNAIKSPCARKISDATMRCLAKCIACFGIGLYVYQGEDIPEQDAIDYDKLNHIISGVLGSETVDSLKMAYLAATAIFKGQEQALKQIIEAKNKRYKELTP
jgi:hypothetical protein